MKAIILLCFATLPVMALDQDGNRLTLSDAEMAKCAQGGCTLVTNRALDEMRQAIILLLAEIERRPRTCKRGDLI